jgi:hypothetical protein
MVTLRRQRSDHVDIGQIAGSISHSHLLWAMVMEQRASGAVPADQIVDLHYGALLRDPVGTIATTYETLGLTLTGEAEQQMRAYLDAKPKDRHGVHNYSIEDFGLDRTELRQSFAPYMAHYDVAEEA